ncbi:MAG TPA: hypothetical protein PLP19_12095 [bacterium]|nr:hypothetical protein [bacterium]HPN44224.1 hypothetical protein [bacterium]
MLIVLSILCMTIFTFCYNPFAPKLEHSNGQGLVITEQKSPDEVLQNFIYAYTFKDSLVYAGLLDSSFVFVYFDPNLGSSGRFVSWGRDVDLKTTGRLFKNFDTITLIWNTTIYQIENETEAEYSKTLQLNMFGASGDFSLNGNAIFNFKLSSYDKKWRITRWKDESTM